MESTIVDELKAVLFKHDAEIVISHDDVLDGDIRMTIEFRDPSCKSIDLGSFINGIRG